VVKVFVPILKVVVVMLNALMLVRQNHNLPKFLEMKPSPLQTQKNVKPVEDFGVLVAVDFVLVVPQKLVIKLN
jgi:hypothetical protein